MKAKNMVEFSNKAVRAVCGGEIQELINEREKRYAEAVADLRELVNDPPDYYKTRGYLPTSRITAAAERLRVIRQDIISLKTAQRRILEGI